MGRDSYTGSGALKPLPDPQPFCDRMDEWAGIAIAQNGNLTPDFEKNWMQVRLAIQKSCLLDRMFYGKERPSQTPCPVHQGKWAGCHFQWPGHVWIGVERPMSAVVVPDMLQGWYDAGCRCAYHNCGCTTGWQPDEHCGCGGEEHFRQAMTEKHGAAYAALMEKAG